MAANGPIAKKVAVIIASTRNKRIGDQVAKVILDIVEPPNKDINFSLLDLKEFKLPVFDEDDMPARVGAGGGKHIHEHTKKWSAAVKSYDGYIFVSPEYNHGPPGGVKNAIDFLFHEWIGKPLMLVTYGIFGGSKSSDALNTVFTGMRVSIVPTRPQLSFPGANPEQRFMSPSLIASSSGQLHEDSVTAWTKNDSEQILKGFAEVKEKLLEVKEEATPGN